MKSMVTEMSKCSKIFSLFVMVVVGCQSVNQSEISTDKKESWAIRMANTVIENHPSLVHYNQKTGKEKLQYDASMLGSIRHTFRVISISLSILQVTSLSMILPNLISTASILQKILLRFINAPANKNTSMLFNFL